MTAAQPGSLSVAAVDEQSVAIDTARWVALATAVLLDEGVTGPAELALWFVDEEEIAVLNDQHMGEHGPTDVLSFPLDASDDEPFAEGMPLLLGDIFICPEVAARNAPDHPGEFDMVVAMLHDHGLIPVKYLGVEQGVNVTLGLPFVRTSPDHGTAFDIAGSGCADPASLLAALRMARRLSAP